jgi:hypothetical protein
VTPQQRRFFERMYAAYQDDMNWADFGNLATSTDNPLILATDGWVTRAVWDHPRFQARRDLEDRLGIRQGVMAPAPGFDIDRDPFSPVELPVGGS